MCDICKTIEKSLNGENPFFVKELETGIVVLGWNQHFYGTINTKTAATLDFSGVAAFLVTN